MTDFLDDKHQEIINRMKELKPLVDEHRQLEAAAAALTGVGGTSAPASAAPAAPRRRGPGRPPGSGAEKVGTAAAPKAAKAPKAPATAKAAAAPKSAAAPKAAKAPKRPGRRKGSGNRAAEAEKFVREQPGSTIPQLAEKMGIKQNYLYRVLPGLEEERKVVKKGKGWYPHPKAGAKAAA